jgi:hypothetical protein
LLYRNAEALYRRASEAGAPRARLLLARMFARQGRVAELNAVAASGDAEVGWLLVKLRAERGPTDELRALATTGNTRAIALLAKLLAKQGCMDELRALGSGWPQAGEQLALELSRRGRVGEVITELRHWEDLGIDQIWPFMEELADQNRVDELRKFAMAHDERVAGDAVRTLARRSLDTGDLEDLRALAVAGNRQVGWQLTKILADRGHLDELRTLAKIGNEDASSTLARILGARHDLDGLRALAQSGNFDAAYQLAVLLLDTDRPQKRRTAELRALLVEHHELNETWDELVAEQLSVNRLRSSLRRTRATVSEDQVDLLAERGRTDDLRVLAHIGNDQAHEALVEILLAQGHVDEATAELGILASRNEYFKFRLVELLVALDHEDELSRLARSGDLLFIEGWARLLARKDRIKDLQALTDAGSWGAASWLFRLLADQGRTEELRREVSAGTPGAVERLLALLTNQGRSELADRTRRFGLNPNGSLAEHA